MVIKLKKKRIFNPATTSRVKNDPKATLMGYPHCTRNWKNLKFADFVDMFSPYETVKFFFKFPSPGGSTGSQQH